MLFDLSVLSMALVLNTLPQDDATTPKHVTISEFFARGKILSMLIWRVCEHLKADSINTDYWQLFTGEDLHYDLACAKCCQAEPHWIAVPEEEFREIEKDCYWDGIAGQPEIKRQPSGQHFVHEVLSLEGLDASAIKAAAPLAQNWLALTASAELLELDAHTKTHRLLATLTDALDLSLHLSLCISKDESLVAIYETRGLKGVVVENPTGKVLFTFLRGEYHHEVSPFGVAFCEHAGRTLLIHTTDWNRLDITDPRTGELLTQREPTSYKKGEPRPEHYLDYFHGSLYSSPDGTWIADDGWIWAPYGVVQAWSLTRWLTENLWESEDGPTRHSPCGRAYFWGGPICWINNTTLAVWGYGNDDDWLLPAVRLFDVESGTERRWFPGPQTSKKGCEFWKPTTPFHNGWMVYDDVLFACSIEHGVSVWDIENGAWLCEDASFYPMAYQRSTKKFLTLLSDGTFQLSQLSE
jgi:hypothetical protein